MMTFPFESFTVAVDIPNQLIVNRQIAEQSIYNTPAKGASCIVYARIVGVKSFRVIVRPSPIFLSPPPHLVSILAQINFPPKYRPTKKPDVQNRKKWLYFQVFFLELLSEYKYLSSAFAGGESHGKEDHSNAYICKKRYFDSEYKEFSFKHIYRKTKAMQAHSKAKRLFKTPSQQCL